MTKGTVIDANCWAKYCDDILHRAEGEGFRVFEKAKTKGAILLDGGDLIATQYKQTSGQTVFETFFNEGVVTGAIKLVKAEANAELRKKLVQLGVPKYEHIFFKTAISGQASYLVSEDIDFFDPRLKLAQENAKEAARRNKNSPVPKAFRKEHNFEICCVAVFLDC
jgi:hypothetical protein